MEQRFKLFYNILKIPAINGLILFIAEYVAFFKNTTLLFFINTPEFTASDLLVWVTILYTGLKIGEKIGLKNPLTKLLSRWKK